MLISIHAPREGGDSAYSSSISCRRYFNPRPPRGGRPPSLWCGNSAGYFNPRPPRGGRRISRPVYSEALRISIHAPREGGDGGAAPQRRSPPYFNPRPPRGGRQRHLHAGPGGRYFNPRPPRGGRPPAPTSGILLRFHFNPRPPRGGRHGFGHYQYGWYIISIHAPREGGDKQVKHCIAFPADFNPRPPRGGRPSCGCCPAHPPRFQSTPPARGATIWLDFLAAGFEFQSTPPARGATCVMVSGVFVLPHFNPRPPRGGRRDLAKQQLRVSRISIHAPREGGDLAACVGRVSADRFQSTPPARGATKGAKKEPPSG